MPRLDLTQQRLFTISEGTRNTLRAIDEPIDVRVYFSKKLGEAAPTYAKISSGCARCSSSTATSPRGKLQVTFLDPEPFSDAEDRAVAAGLQGHAPQPGRRDGLLRPRRHQLHRHRGQPSLLHRPTASAFLEYDVTKLIVHAGEPDQEARRRPHQRHPARRRHARQCR